MQNSSENNQNQNETENFYACVIDPAQYRPEVSPIQTRPEVDKFVGHVIGSKTLSL